MNLTLAAAGILAIIVGIIHSVLGEKLIFKHLREDSVVPTKPAPPLRQRNIRILWATWHMASVFGWTYAAVLLYMAVKPESVNSVFVQFIAASMFLSSALVLIATKAKHPGWIGLLIVGLLCWFS